MRTIYLTLILLSITLISCRTIEKLVEQGRYDEAFALGVKNLAGKKNKKRNHVLALEKAYRALNERDFVEIAQIKDHGYVGNYDRVIHLYNRILDRQYLVSALLPLVAKDGYVATFKQYNFDQEISNLTNLVVEFHYNQAELYLKDARLGNKRAARKAYTSIKNLKLYRDSYHKSERMLDEALDLGIERIGVDILVDGSFYHWGLVEEKLFHLDLSKYNTTWEKFYFYEPGVTYDNQVIIEVFDIDLGMEREWVDVQNYSKEIEDGYDEVCKTVDVEVIKVIEVPVKVTLKDKDGESPVCSSIKLEKREEKHIEKKVVIEKVPRFKTVCASVTSITREKRSSMHGVMKVYGDVSDMPITTRPIDVLSTFSGGSVDYSGDTRALGTLCTSSDSYLEPFPSDLATVNILADNFKYSFESEIRKYDFLSN